MAVSRRVVLIGSLAIPLIGIWTLAAWGRQSRLAAECFTLYALVLVGVVELARRRGRRPAGWMVTALAVLHLGVLAPEVGLRLAGFRYEPGIRFGYPRPHQLGELRRDETLFWTLRPETPGVSPQGFQTLPLPRSREPGRARAVFLGDSVAFQGYPEMAAALLDERRPGRWEVVNLSLSGYSSHQGRKLMELYGEAMAADVVVVGYGWNDHWLAWVAVDAEQEPPSPSPSESWLAALLHRSRIVQLARRLTGAGPRRPLDQVRVPLAEYRENLVAIGEAAAARGAVPLLLTLPSSHAKLGVPDYLLDRRFATDAASAVELHRTYNRTVREVAAEHGWAVLDLETEVESLPAEDLESLFVADGIHLTAPGLSLFARRVADRLDELVPAGAEEPER